MIQKTTQNQSSQTILNNALLKKTIENAQSINTILYEDIPGISYLKPFIEKYLIFPLKSESKNLSRKLVLRGEIGCGKTMLVESICKMLQMTLLVTKTSDFLETLNKSKHLKNNLILISDLDDYEDKEKINLISEYLMKNKDVFVIAECRKEIDKKLRKYGCFENEILFLSPGKNERKEILTFFFKKKLLNIDLDFFEMLAVNTPGYSISEICILSRKAILNSEMLNEDLSEKHYQMCFKEKNTKTHNLNFNDIGGLDNVKNELYNSIILPTLHYERYKKLKIKISSNILLYGEPGCGKTLLAKAVSNISHCNFISIKGPELISKYVGDTEKELRSVFDEAKKLQPCVIFFDEIDSICQKRNNNGYADRIVNQILTLLDGFDDYGDVFVIGATNKIENIDEALLRPGRFDKLLKVPLPSFEEMIQIFYKSIGDISYDQINFEKIFCQGFNGADIAGIVKEAKMLYLKENMCGDEFVINAKYFYMAAEKIKNQKNFLDN